MKIKIKTLFHIKLKMGACCSDHCSLKNEDTIRNVFLSLSITKFTYQDLKSLLVSITLKKANNNKETLKDDLEKLFYEKNKIKNANIRFHSKFFEEFHSMLKTEFDIHEVLLLAYPLLRKKRNKIYEEFVEIMANTHGKFYSANKLHQIFMRIFELYTYRITKIMQLEAVDEETRAGAAALIKHVFTYDNINKAIDRILKRFDSEANMDEFCISSEEVCESLKDKNFFSLEQIRDFVIDNEN